MLDAGDHPVYAGGIGSTFTEQTSCMKQTFHDAITGSAAIMFHFFLSAALFALAAVNLSGCAVHKQEAEATHARAWETMTTAVAEQLDNPENLLFPANGVNDVTHLGSGRYQATSYADFTNRDGGRERAYFYGVVVFRDNAWTVETIKFSR
jgi:hypothetical protein